MPLHDVTAALDVSAVSTNVVPHYVRLGFLKFRVKVAICSGSQGRFRGVCSEIITVKREPLGLIKRGRSAEFDSLLTHTMAERHFRIFWRALATCNEVRRKG